MTAPLHPLHGDLLQLVLARAALRVAADRLFICTVGPKSDAEWEEAYEKWIAAGEYVEALKHTGVN